jgi:hypothetical protein
MNEQEIQEAISKLITIRNKILDLKDRQIVIESTRRKMDKEYIENDDQIIALGEEGKATISQLVLEQ